MGGSPKPEAFENDFCAGKMVAMHKPTHEPKAEKAGEYPFAYHLSGKRRLWEIRIQLRFKQLPRKPLQFGMELGRYVPLSAVTRQAQKALVGACKTIVGDCYHSPGDDPDVAKGELEPPTFMMPLWAFDQFLVSSPGSEPDLCSDLEGQGMRRSDSAKNYIKAMTSCIESFSTEKVYTFAFWGVSQFLDVMRWQVVGGLLPGVTMDLSKFCGTAPFSLAIYELDGMGAQDADKRHLPSRKRYYFNVSVWSNLTTQGASGSAQAAAPSFEVDEWGNPVGWGDYLQENIQMRSENVMAAAPPKAADLGFDDLLGLSEPAQAPSQPAPAAPAAKPLAETFDLLDLGS